MSARERERERASVKVRKRERESVRMKEKEREKWRGEMYSITLFDEFQIETTIDAAMNSTILCSQEFIGRAFIKQS